MAIAKGEANDASLAAEMLAARAAPGEIVLTPTAAEGLAGWLPDGFVLRAETIDLGDGDAAAFVLRRATDVVPHALPTPSTRLIGRGDQVRGARELLHAERLVTLTGPPGSGKTRLAVEIGLSALGTFADGAWFVPLAPIQHADLIATAVAETLGLKEDATTSMEDVIGHHLAAREMLLILDNFEHVLAGSRTLASWLAAAPRLRIVVTSRAPTHLSGEREYLVPPLSVPADPDDPAAAATESVQLFVDRAQAVAPSFASDRDSLPEIARICHRLDGLPLAIEIAAARVKVLPVAAIGRRLDESLELLTSSAPDVPDRHRSLTAAVSWSYGLLSPIHQAAFRRLAIFRGGWDLEAADAVTLASAELSADTLDLMTLLLDESLIRRQPDIAGEPRFEMLETLREFGRERLVEAGEADAVAERHAQWFLGRAERAEPLLTGRDQRKWLDRLDRDADNLRASLRWAINHRHAELGMRLGAALWRLWHLRGHISEARQVMDELLALDAEVPPLVRARALSAAGSLAYWQYDQVETTRLYEASLTLRRAAGDPAELASGLYDLGTALNLPGPTANRQRARQLETEALDLYRSLGDSLGEARLVFALGANSYFSGDHESALRELAHSAELFRSLDDRFGLAWVLDMIGLAAFAVGRLEVAGSSWREALQRFGAADDESGIEAVLRHLAQLARQRGDEGRAIRLGIAAARARGTSESALGAPLSSGIEDGEAAGDRSARVRGLTAQELDAARQEAEAMSTAEAVAYALEPEALPAAGAFAQLRVFALGPMRAERQGVPIRSWGGEKAGSRQAQAIFAFLFDRGPKGVTKDEVTDLLWPDLPIQRGDLAFHRTLSGLRSVLEKWREPHTAIEYEGGRYRLNSALVAWSDVNSFEEGLDAAAHGGREAIRLLQEACNLYRGDFFDDCPLYGDSMHVEERRTYLRGRFEDALLLLADRHAEVGDANAAAGRYRQALTVNPESVRARLGLDRLKV
ncbi:MAG TPA: hypothetical protein VF365_01450 [Candidatus Limnocylindria bacterium]